MTQFEQYIFALIAIVMFLAVLSYLRVLAIFRQRQLETHEVARKAAAMRREYEQRKAEEHATKVLDV